MPEIDIIEVAPVACNALDYMAQAKWRTKSQKTGVQGIETSGMEGLSMR